MKGLTRRKYFLFSIVFGFFFLVASYSVIRHWLPANQFQKELSARVKSPRAFGEVTVGGHRLTVVYAQTATEITQGLSGRESIGAEAMVFRLPQRSTPSFWMYQMQFPLDFVWIDSGKVIDIHEHVPSPLPDASRANIATVRPQSPVTEVMELPAGTVSQLKIQLGDRYTEESPLQYREW